MATEKMEFQTEVRDMLNLMINSLYSNKEIFLRELVSNAADALDKRRFLSLSGADLLPVGTQLRIDISVNKEGKRIVVEDNGIGMNKEDLINCLGTIARSGTKNFIKNLKEGDKGSVDLIGQFGVGFYSVFMVAKKVEVLTLKAGEKQGYLWASEGTGDFEISEAPLDKVGTKLTLYLKDDEDAEDFASEWKIKDIVQKYSGFVSYGIYFHPEATKNDKGEIEEKPEERLNEKQALWRQSEKEVTEEQYKDFYNEGLLQRHQPRSRRTGRLEPQSRRRFPGILEPRVYSVEGPVQHLAQRRFAWPEALCEESLYHGRLQGSAAALAPLCARRGG